MEDIMRIISTSLLVTTAFLGLCASHAHAQTLIVAKVPFAFTLRGQQFPAGTYEVREVGTSAGMLSIHGAYNGKMSFTFARPVSGLDPAGNKPALVFNHHENVYELSEIWQSAREGVTLPSADGKSEISRADTGTDGSGELTYLVAETLK
jgi:hypothetical protein